MFALFCRKDKDRAKAKEKKKKDPSALKEREVYVNYLYSL